MSNDNRLNLTVNDDGSILLRTMVNHERTIEEFVRISGFRPGWNSLAIEAANPEFGVPDPALLTGTEMQTFHLQRIDSLFGDVEEYHMLSDPALISKIGQPVLRFGLASLMSLAPWRELLIRAGIDQPIFAYGSMFGRATCPKVVSTTLDYKQIGSSELPYTFHAFCWTGSVVSE